MNKLVTTLILVLTALVAYSQQDAMFTHYMFNTQAVNPAYAGSRDALTITGLHRSQWVGFDGAPVTQTLTAHSPIYLKNAGIGLSVINDKLGFVNSTAIFLDFSYRVRIAGKGWLAFGLKGGTNYRKTDFTEMKLDNPADPDFEYDVHSGWLPNIGAGLYYYADKFYAGISSPKFIENDFETSVNQLNSDFSGERKHYYVIAGYLADLNSDWKLKPTTFVKITQNAPVSFDLSAQAIYREKLWVGAMFRSGDAAGILAGVFITPQFSMGYSFDWSYANRTFAYNFGSHEVMLRYDFDFLEKKQFVSPRYFYIRFKTSDYRQQNLKYCKSIF